MNKSIKPGDSQQTSLSIDDVKSFVLNDIGSENKPRIIMNKLKRRLQAGKLKAGTTTPEDQALLQKAMFCCGMSNHMVLTISTNKDLEPLALQMTDDIIRENNCTTSTEKSIVHTAVSAYCRMMRCAQLLENSYNRESINDLLIQWDKHLGTEIDRAHRQFQAAMQTLRMLKAPPLKVNFRTDTAYIAQNQQINSGHKPEEEIIDPA